VGNYDIATKGWIYYIEGRNKEGSGQKEDALMSYDIRKGSSKLIYKSNTEMLFPSSDGDGHVLVESAEKDMPTGKEGMPVIMEIDVDDGTTRSLASSSTGFWFPMWAQKRKSIAYLEVKDQGETATLCMIDLETKTTESLMTSVTPLCRVHITEDGKWAVATVATGKDSGAAARVNLQGKHVVEYLTPKDETAIYGTLSSDGNRIAYCVGEGDNFEKVVVKNLKSGAEKVIWHAEKK
jgi:Tol biopolymer transport system component